MIIKRVIAVVAAALTALALSVTSADAANKKRDQYRSDAPYRYRAEPRYRYGSEPPSLDGRVTGYPRTCGFNTFQYDGTGDILGPMCH
jgi:hypothetical protein